MPDLGSPEAIFTAVIGVVGFALGTWLRVGPGRQVSDMADAILGKPETKDRAGKVSTPAVPGLVHRTAVLEQAVETLTKVVADQASYNERLTRVEQKQITHGVRITSLERGEAERVAIREESAAMLRLAADRDVVDVESDEP